VIRLCLVVVILAILTESGWALLYGVMEYGDESLTLTVYWIMNVRSEYRIAGDSAPKRERTLAFFLCHLAKNIFHERR